MGKRAWAWWLAAAVLVAVVTAWLTADTAFPTRAVALPAVTTLPPIPDILLTGDGIGPVAFGDPEEAALDQMIALLGPPLEDSTGPCVEGDTRWTRWGNLSVVSRNGVVVAFITGIYFPEDAPMIPVHTEEGVTLGTSGEDLQALFGDRLSFGDPEDGPGGIDVRTFAIDGYDPDQSEFGLGGYLEGELETGTVITIVGGNHCPELT